MKLLNPRLAACQAQKYSYAFVAGFDDYGKFSKEEQANEVQNKNITEKEQ